MRCRIIPTAMRLDAELSSPSIDAKYADLEQRSLREKQEFEAKDLAQQRMIDEAAEHKLKGKAELEKPIEERAEDRDEDYSRRQTLQVARAEAAFAKSDSKNIHCSCS